MTISARNWAWDAQKIRDAGEWRDMHPGEKLTLLCIAELENADEGYAYPSQEYIALRTKQNDRTIRRHLKLFIDTGVMQVDKRRARGGTWQHSVYILAVPDKYRHADPEWMSKQEGDGPVFR